MRSPFLHATKNVIANNEQPLILTMLQKGKKVASVAEAKGWAAGDPGLPP
jgi:hypothetical protein